jgi:hypothetical protein
MRSSDILKVFQEHVQNDSVTNMETLLAYAVGATTAKLECYIIEDRFNLHQVFLVNSKTSVIEHLASQYKSLGRNSLVNKFEPLVNDFGICKHYSNLQGASRYDVDFVITYKAASDCYDRCLAFIKDADAKSKQKQA